MSVVGGNSAKEIKEDGRRKGREEKVRHGSLQVGKSSHLEDLVYHAQEFRFYLKLNEYLLKIKPPMAQSNYYFRKISIPVVCCINFRE